MFKPFDRAAKAAVILLAMVAAPALAQPEPPQPRLLEVPASAAWQHAETQMILPPEVAGLRRRTIQYATAEELDVVAEYRDESGDMVASVYLFRSSVANLPLWFDRALTSILLRPDMTFDSTALPAPAPFARPGSSVTSGLRIALDIGNVEAGSTGLALVPLGHFLLKIRLSSASLDRAALDARLTRFIEGLRWPAPVAEVAATPIEPCVTPLRLRRARVVEADMGNVLLNLLGGIAAGDEPQFRSTYCREPGTTLHTGVYRPDASRESYLIALGDSGIAITVGEGMSLERSGPRYYSMRWHDRASISALPSFNRLPPPEQALAVAMGPRAPTISVSTGEGDAR